MKTYKFILLLILFVSCKHSKDQFLDDFGLFINDTEANYDQYSDTEFKIVEINFIEFKEQETDLKDYFSESEQKRIKEYHNRFRKVKIKRDPLNNLLEIFN
ncbi:MAG: hypothetical protein P8P29_08335 [Flavobacteriaceae bacterium]|nr:hypothetical protein [Flavobacteriaceae bacterium]